MKNYFLLYLIVNALCLMPCNAQSKLGNEWINGRGAKVKFINNSVTTKYNVLATNHYFDIGHSNICDSNGNLILCSDGFHIYDSNALLIDSGDSLIPSHYANHYSYFSSYSQSSIFLPMNSNKYYFVTPSNSEGNLCYSCHNDVLYYAVIDMDANGGAGKVIKRKQPLMINGNFRKTQMMACRHANGKDWWLLKQAGDSNTIYKFLFTQDSVYNMGFQQFDYPIWGVWDITGQSTFSSNGRKYATTSHGSSSGKIFLADFDRCYGILSNPKEIIMPWGYSHNINDTSEKERLIKGLAFSPNDELLYVISESNIYQYDLQVDTWFHVAGLDTSWQKFQFYDASYLGPDGKLYIGNFGGLSKQMSVINNPDVKGAGCNFCPRCLRFDSLGLYAAASTPPCMPNYSLGKDTCWALDVTEHLAVKNELEVFPNPSSTVLYIKSKSKSNRELFNSIGQLLFTTKHNEINVSRYRKGIYYLKVENSVRKIIIE
jgi:hypothetical protein